MVKANCLSNILLLTRLSLTIILGFLELGVQISQSPLLITIQENKKMIDKKLQDYVWTILPKEFRRLVQKEYKNMKDNYKAAKKVSFISQENMGITKGVLKTICILFGDSNIKSDIDSEGEMIINSKESILRVYRNIELELLETSNPIKKVELKGRILMIRDLFPELELPPVIINDIGDFNIGDRVIFHRFKSNQYYDAKIIEINKGYTKPYILQLKDQKLLVYRWEIEPLYDSIEPKYKVGDKVRIKDTLNKEDTIKEVVGNRGFYSLNHNFDNQLLHESRLELIKR